MEAVIVFSWRLLSSPMLLLPSWFDKECFRSDFWTMTVMTVTAAAATTMTALCPFPVALIMTGMNA